MSEMLQRARGVPQDLIVKGGECEPHSAARPQKKLEAFELHVVEQAPHDEEDKDHFITRDGLTYAGQHLIVDMWDGQGFENKELIEAAFRRAVEAAKATLLHIHLHQFTGGGGVSGVAVLAESHISIHTWPERGFAAIDIFMCGDATPLKAVEELRKAFKPAHTSVAEHKRGIV